MSDSPVRVEKALNGGQAEDALVTNNGDREITGARAYLEESW